MWKKTVFAILLILVIVGGIYWFTYTKKINTPVSSAMNAIPSNAAFIFESKQSTKTWAKLSQTNDIWKELLNTETFSKLNKQTHYIDSLTKTNKSIVQLLNNGSIFVSAHVSGANTFDFLYVYSLPNLGNQSTLEQFIKSVSNNIEPTYRDYDDVDIATIYPTKKDSLSYVILKGILMISAKKSLVEASIRQLKSGISIANDKNFSKIISTAGKNADANIYLNYKNLPNILNHFINPTLKREYNAIPDFADFSGWDITIKPNAFMLNGFTQANDSTANFLNLFLNQKPQKIELTKVLPSKTAFFLFWGISNVKTFQHDYQKYLITKKYATGYKKYIEDINKKYHINIQQSMLDWIDNEIALVITEPSSSNYINNSYAVIRSNNIEDAINSLNTLTDSVNNIDHSEIDTSSYRNHIINHLKLANVLSHLFGNQFDKINNNYFTSIDDYIVFANTSEALNSFINDFENNKTLSNDKNYQSFSENISNDANIYMYSSIARSTNIYRTFVSEELAKNIEDKVDLFNKFEGIGVQFTSSNKLFYSNIYLKYNPHFKKEMGTIWESKLDTSISSKPQVLINHNTKAKEIFVQDDANKIYLINNTGKIIWRKQLNEKIMSNIIQIDALNNNKLQMLFNTKSAIYILDRNGNEMRSFPIRLKSSATNPISVFDYEQNKDYRIFVACENNTIECYKTNGKKLTDFKLGKTNYKVKLPIQYFNFNGKDHLCAVDEKGKIYIFNRKGEISIQMKENLAPAIHTFFTEQGKDKNSTFIIAADTLGDIIKINLSGNKERIKIQNFESFTDFNYKDLNNDKIKEYIFLTKNELNVFSKDKSLLFNYEFKEEVIPKLQYFSYPEGKDKIGVVSRSQNEIYLFNENGTICKDFPLTAKTPFEISDLNNQGFYNLISGSSNNSIYVYQLK
jgi:hypothetical protein